MNPPVDAYKAMLERLCASSRMSAVLVDASGSIVWKNEYSEEEFPGLFVPGAGFQTELDRGTLAQLGRGEPLSEGSAGESGELRRTESGSVYRHSCLHLGEAGPDFQLHCLLNVSAEKRLEEHFLLNLQQLRSMKEIVDILYQSMSTPEVIYLCLIAVTAQMGFGFNRAFFLQVTGGRMRGRFGIGPSNPEEAHTIWSRFATQNFSSLRQVYEDFTRSGGMPDPRTQEIAIRMDFELQKHGWHATQRESLRGILGVLARGKPAQLHASDPGTQVDRELFERLGTDTVAVVPLFVRGELAGVIIADNLITRKAINEADLNVLKTFAGYAGLALERSHLYDELRQSVAKLQAANETLKTSQQRLLQAEKLSAIGELAAYVSHEIRNPLVAIGGLARSLIKDQVDDPDTAETLQIIATQVNRLEKFLRETLDFVKPRVAGVVPADVLQIVRESLATFKNELSENAIEVELETSEDAVICQIDPDLLRHALSNLIKNAIEAMKGGGRLLVGVVKNGVSGTIRIGDTGPGIPAEARPRIFDPFFTTKPEGTGLGLSIASQNIRGLGGQLELEPGDEYRTVFRLTLPLQLRQELVTARS